MSLIAALSGAIGGAVIVGLFSGHPIGGLLSAPLPSVATWLILMHFMRYPTWPRTMVVGLLSPLIGSVLVLCLPIGVILWAWYISFPLGLITAVAVRAVLLAHPDQLVDYPACGICGYNLTGNTSGVCPECGTPLDRAALDVADS